MFKTEKYSQLPAGNKINESISKNLIKTSSKGMIITLMDTTMATYFQLFVRLGFYIKENIIINPKYYFISCAFD